MPSILLLKCSVPSCSKLYSRLCEKVRALEECVFAGPVPYVEALNIIQTSPVWASKLIHERADTLKFKSIIARAPIHEKIHRVAYGMFFESLHPAGSVFYKLINVYSERWCTEFFETRYAEYLTYTACQNLKWLSLHLPSRAHLANVRFHFNAWHTNRRYQRRDKLCIFCGQEGSQDSIEHIVVCQVVQACLPSSLKAGTPPSVPAKTFFLIALDDDTKVVMGVFIFALYTMHNEVRHGAGMTDFKKTIRRIMTEIYMKPRILKLWEALFGFTPVPRPRIRLSLGSKHA